MNVSNVSSTDYYSGAISSSAKFTKSNSLQKALRSLESDLESGDTTSASTKVNDIFLHAPKTSSSASPTDSSLDTVNNGDQITQYLKSLMGAIASGAQPAPKALSPRAKIT